MKGVTKMENQTMKIDTKINGVNIDELGRTIDTIKEKPEIAKFKFRASNTWINGGHNRTNVKNFYGAGQEHTSRKVPFTMDADEPPVLLGEDRGANPVEYVLTALSACLTTSMVYHAAARGYKIEELESRIEGDLDLHGFLGLSENIRKGYQNLRISFKVKGDVTTEQLKELSKFSPVYDIVSNPVPVDIQIEKA